MTRPAVRRKRFAEEPSVVEAWRPPSPLVGEGAEDRRSEAGGGVSFSDERAGTTPHPVSLRSTTLSHKGRGEERSVPLAHEPERSCPSAPES